MEGMKKAGCVMIGWCGALLSLMAMCNTQLDATNMNNWRTLLPRSEEGLKSVVLLPGEYECCEKARPGMVPAVHSALMCCILSEKLNKTVETELLQESEVMETVKDLRKVAKVTPYITDYNEFAPASVRLLYYLLIRPGAAVQSSAHSQNQISQEIINKRLRLIMQFFTTQNSAAHKQVLDTIAQEAMAACKSVTPETVTT